MRTKTLLSQMVSDKHASCEDATWWKLLGYSEDAAAQAADEQSNWC